VRSESRAPYHAGSEPERNAVKILFPVLIAAALAAQVMAAEVSATAATTLPKIQGVSALAVVEGDPVSWTVFINALSAVHAEAHEGAKRKKQDPLGLLDRLITGKLIAQESRNIGLDQTPEYKEAVATFKQETLTAMLLERQAKSVEKSDPADVQRFYRAEAGLARFDSLLFSKQAEADAFVAKVKRGGDFATEAKAAVSQGQSKSFDQGGGGKLGTLQPEIVAALTALAPGQVSGAIAIKAGWVVAKLLELTYPNDAAAQAKAEEQALEWKRLQAVKAYTSELSKRYVKLDTKLFEGLDFDAPQPGIAALKKDTRVVATIQGGKPVTVGELATEIDKAFFHGTEKAAKEKKVTPKKYAALDELLVARLTIAEGARLGLDKTPEFKDKKREYEEGLLFTAFLKKVVLPDVKVGEGDIKAWYEGHKKDYSSPGMLRLESIAFVARSDAETARTKAASGADFGWLKKNSGGQVPPDADVMRLNGVYVVDDVDADMAKTLASPKEGEARLFASPGGPVYVILIREVIPSTTKPYAEVRAEAGQAVIDEKTKAVLDTWAAKLRASYEVKTFVTPAQLDALIKNAFGPKA
jgi:hypothetical protein